MKKNHSSITVLSFLVLCSLYSVCGEADTSRHTSSQEVYPKIGLVLSGGGARGFAHIGVMKVLEELGIPIDYIVGTSMGSIIGGLYASGFSAEELEQLSRDIDWENIFSDTPPRHLWSYQKKRDASKYQLSVNFDVGQGLVVPQGLTSGRKISTLMALLTLPVADIEQFDLLPIPYRAIATDIVTGEEVIVDQGALSEAMRASMAVPGAFTPVKTNDHVLVDGGVVKNLPVDVVKQMGADIVIAVDISSPLKTEEELGDPISILAQMIDLQILKVTEEQRKMADVLLVPDLTGYSSVSFGEAEAISALGEKSARLQIDELEALSDRLRETRPAGRTLPDSFSQRVDDIYIENLEIEGPSQQHASRLWQSFQAQIGATLMPDFLEDTTTDILSSGEYESVKFTLAPGKEGGKILKLHLEERRKELHQLRFGMNYASRFDDPEPDKMVLLANVTLNHLTGPGSRWSNDVQFVNVTKFDSEYIQPLGNTWFLAPHLYDYDDYQLIYDDQESVARYNRDETGVEVRLGVFIKRIGEVSLGFLLEDIDVSPSTAVARDVFQAAHDTLTSVTFRTRFDWLDSSPFPHSGGLLSVDYQMASTDLGGDANFQRVFLDYGKYFGVSDRQTLKICVQVGTDFDSELKAYILMQLKNPLLSQNVVEKKLPDRAHSPYISFPRERERHQSA